MFSRFFREPKSPLNHWEIHHLNPIGHSGGLALQYCAFDRSFAVNDIKKQILSLFYIPKFHSSLKFSSNPFPTTFKLKWSYFYPKLIDLPNNLLKTGPSVITEVGSFTPGRTLSSCLTVGASNLPSPTIPWQVPSTKSWPPIEYYTTDHTRMPATDCGWTRNSGTSPAIIHTQVCILVLLETLVMTQYPTPQTLYHEHLHGEHLCHHRQRLCKAGGKWPAMDTLSRCGF